MISACRTTSCTGELEHVDNSEKSVEKLIKMAKEINVKLDSQESDLTEISEDQDDTIENLKSSIKNIKKLDYIGPPIQLMIFPCSGLCGKDAGYGKGSKFKQEEIRIHRNLTKGLSRLKLNVANFSG